MDGRDLGTRAGRSPAVSRRVVSADRTRWSRLAVSAPRVEYRASRRERPGGAGDCADSCQVVAAGRDAGRGSLRPAAGTRRERRLDHRPGRFDAGTLLHGGLLGICTLEGWRLPFGAALRALARNAVRRALHEADDDHDGRHACSLGPVDRRLAQTVLAVGAGLRAVRVDDCRVSRAAVPAVRADCSREPAQRGGARLLLPSFPASPRARRHRPGHRGNGRMGNRGRCRLVRRVAASQSASRRATPRCRVAAFLRARLVGHWRGAYGGCRVRVAAPRVPRGRGLGDGARHRGRYGVGRCPWSASAPRSRCRGACGVRLLRCRAAAGRLGMEPDGGGVSPGGTGRESGSAGVAARHAHHRRRANAQLGMVGTVFGAPAIYPRRFDDPGVHHHALAAALLSRAMVRRHAPYPARLGRPPRARAYRHPEVEPGYGGAFEDDGSRVSCIEDADGGPARAEEPGSAGLEYPAASGAAAWEADARRRSGLAVGGRIHRSQSGHSRSLE